MGTSFTGEVSSDRLTGESHLSAKRHINWRLALTLWALWLEKTNLYVVCFQIIEAFKKMHSLMERLSDYDDSELPPFLVPLKRLIVRVSSLINDVRSDIMGFYNVSILISV